MGSVRRARAESYLGFLGLNVLVSAATAWFVFSMMDRRQPAPPPSLTPTMDVVARLASVVPSATVTVPASPTPATYTVLPGDTLYDIAVRLGVPLDALMAANRLIEPSALTVGQVLLIPSLEDIAELQATVTPRPPVSNASATPPTSPEAPRVEIRGVDGAGDLVRETVRLLNTGGVAAMAGWTLEDGQGHVFIFPSFTLYNGAISVHTKAGQNTVIDLYWGLTEAIWTSGKVITLRDADGDVQSTFRIP